MAFQVNPNSPGYIPPQQRPPATAQSAPQPPAAGDQVNLSAAPPPPPKPNVKSFSNGLSVQYSQHNGATTGLYATLPGGPNGLLTGPIMVSVSTLPGQNTLGVQFQKATAYEMGPDGKVLRDDQNKPKELPTTILSDGRIYVQTDAAAPLVMLDPDGSYGLATPARVKVAGDEQGAQGYTREQAEFIKPDGTRGFRVNEDVGAAGQASSGGLSSLTGLLTMGMAPGAPAGGREVTYTEVTQTRQGALESRDVHFTQGPNQAWPGFSEGNQWKALLAMNAPDSRERTVVQEGYGMRLEGGWSGKRMLKLFTGQSGLGANSWTYGKQETIRFVPLSTQRQMGQTAAPPPTPAAPPPLPNTPPPLPDNF